MDKQLGNCAVSLKVPESAVLWLDEKSPYSKVEVKSSKHSHDALWSKKNQKKKKNLDYKDNSSSQWCALMSHSPRTRPAPIIKMDLGGEGGKVTSATLNLHAAIVCAQILFHARNKGLCFAGPLLGLQVFTAAAAPPETQL